MATNLDTVFDECFSDEEFFADMLESAFLSGTIDGLKQQLAYVWVRCNQPEYPH